MKKSSNKIKIRIYNNNKNKYKKMLKKTRKKRILINLL